MEKIILYIHGKGGSAAEAAHYQSIFSDCRVIGLDYAAQSPWEAREEFPALFDAACGESQSVQVIASSLGAFFTMCALGEKPIERAYFISPVVDMEKLISDMMTWANVTETELRDKQEIQTDFGETLSWAYLCDVRAHPIRWTVPTYILYGEKDNLISYETISSFADKTKTPLTVMKDGEHWFHTEEQMNFLDKWIEGCRTASASNP